MQDLINRIKGCLYGQVIGDTLGFGTEALTKSEVISFYPSSLKDYSEICNDSRREGWPKGMWTDDTEMMLSIMDCILENQEHLIPIKSLAQHFLRFSDKWGEYCGIITKKVLSFAPPIYEEDPIAVSKLVWNLKGRNNAPNGGLMRTSIIGLWPFNVAENAINVCQMSHYDKRCVCSCVIVSLIIYNLVWKYKELSINEILSIGNQFDSECEMWIMSAYNNSDISKLNLDDEESRAYTYRSLSAALWSYFHAPDFVSGLLTIVNEGGDADTNAAIACAILGAKFGFTSIPSVYIEGLYKKEEYEEKVSCFIKCLKANYINS